MASQCISNALMRLAPGTLIACAAEATILAAGLTSTRVHRVSVAGMAGDSAHCSISRSRSTTRQARKLGGGVERACCEATALDPLTELAPDPHWSIHHCTTSVDRLT